MKPVVSIGTEDFEAIRTGGYFYVDKTRFIKEWWESGDMVTLITRPRRFGKTLNMSMLDVFFSNQHKNKGHLFENLFIWQEESYRQLQGTYPVIALSFAGIKGDSYETAREGIIQVIINLYAKYRFLLQGDLLNQQEKEYFDFVKPNMPDAVAALALHRLAICMNRFFGKKVIILLDEYDTPLQEAYVSGNWDKLVAFIRSLFNYTFKTNPYLERGIMTGITRISKESIFSDLNNLAIATTTSEQYATCFGFTEDEVFEALDQQGLSEKREIVKTWYDGFAFGSHKDIYNPWSIISFLKYNKLKAYWVNTSSNRLAGKLIQEGSPDIKMAMEDLLEGKSIETPIDEEIAFNQLDGDEVAIWSMLLASGYLKVESAPRGVSDYDDPGDERYQLSLTNREVKRMFKKMIREWFGDKSTRYNDFMKALLAGDVDYMNQYMNQITLRTFSSFDAGTHPSKDAEPERFYHGFVLGLIVDLASQYRITSNRESGLGRYDVVLEPLEKNKKAIVLEFKVMNPAKEKDLRKTVKNALKQINDKNYDEELLAKGIAKTEIRHYGFAFKGKEVLIGTDT